LIILVCLFFEKKTINAMVEFFQTSKGIDLERLTSATLMKLEEIKERTATGELITNLTRGDPLNVFKSFNMVFLTT